MPYRSAAGWSRKRTEISMWKIGEWRGTREAGAVCGRAPARAREKSASAGSSEPTSVAKLSERLSSSRQPLAPRSRDRPPRGSAAETWACSAPHRPILLPGPGSASGDGDGMEVGMGWGWDGGGDVSVSVGAWVTQHRAAWDPSPPLPSPVCIPPRNSFVLSSKIGKII